MTGQTSEDRESSEVYGMNTKEPNAGEGIDEGRRRLIVDSLPIPVAGRWRGALHVDYPLRMTLSQSWDASSM